MLVFERASLLLQQGFDAKIDALHKAPHNERKSCTMPNAADEEGEHQGTHNTPHLPATQGKRQRGVNVIGQPVDQRHVPTTPKFRHGSGKERPIEVGDDIQAHATGGTNGYQRIASQVAIHLNWVKQGGQGQCGAIVMGKVVEYRIHINTATHSFMK